MEKLKSRKFWTAIITAAYFALMAMREQGVESTIGTIVFGALAAVVVVGYIIMEGMLDSDRIIEGGEEEFEEESEGEVEEEEAA